MLVSDLIERMRLRGIDYDRAHVKDEQLLPEIQDIEREILEVIIGMGISSYPLIQDTVTPIDVSVYAASYPLPAEFWKPRRVSLVTTTVGARPITVQLVTPEHAASVPHIHPSAYIEDGELWPVDGVTDGAVGSRIYGWQNAETAVVRWVPDPELKGVSDLLDIPSDAVTYASLKLGLLVAKRGRSSDSTVQQMQRDVQRAEQVLQAAVQNHAGAGYRGV